MRVVVAAVLFATGMAVLPAAAQTSRSPQLTQQQERMKSCNSEAGSQKLTGDARKSFMSDCLAGKSTAQVPAASQQQKMKDCNTSASAQKLSGDGRRQYMSNCLRRGG